MGKYIDADKAKNGIMKFVNEYGEIVGMFVNDFNILLERCAVDVQEVVRCRECEMWSDSFEVKDVGRRCLNFRIITKPDFYCGWGSKK